MTSITQYPVTESVYTNPTLTITDGAADSDAVPSTGAHEAHVELNFGSPAGSYTSPTVTMYTSFDNGDSWLSIGAPKVVTLGAVNLISILAQAPTAAGVTTTTASASSACGFGHLFRVGFTASGYGTKLPVTVSVLLK
jgi:hypothetical protein